MRRCAKLLSTTCRRRWLMQALHRSHLVTHCTWEMFHSVKSETHLPFRVVLSVGVRVAELSGVSSRPKTRLMGQTTERKTSREEHQQEEEREKSGEGGEQ